MGTPRIVVVGRACRYEAQIRDELADRLSPGAYHLDAAAEPEADSLDGANIVLAFDLDAAVVRSADRLEWVQALNAGVDHYPLDVLREREIVLTNASGVHADPIGEQVLGYIVLFHRRIIEGIRQQREGRWAPYGGDELADATVGIVGVGAIGGRVAELAAGFGMEVLGVKRDPSSVPAGLDAVHPPDALGTVLEQSDYLVLACPLTDETRGLIDDEALERLPESAVVINIARGEIVDETALIEAIRTRSIRGAALDVFETEPLPESSPLRELRPVVTTPHVAGSTPHYIERAMDIFETNLTAYRAGGPLENRIV